MPIIVSVIQMTVALLLDVLQFMMFARAIVSWFPNLSETKLGEFLYTVTEWVILPMRTLFDKLGWGNEMIIDLPFFATFILLSIIGILI